MAPAVMTIEIKKESIFVSAAIVLIIIMNSK